MKKIISTFAVACIAFSLTGCNKNIPMQDCLNTNMGSTGYNQIMKTENGYYYNATRLGDMSLRYHDNTTGKDIYLCAKPECTHDGGDKFCTATSKGFHVYYTGIYGSNIYIAASETDGKQISFKLLKASLDGTELTEVCTFVQTNGSERGMGQVYSNSDTMILHRGYAFIPYYLVTSETEFAGKAGLAIVNLSDKSIQYMPEYEFNNTKGYMNVIPYGDYIYYTVTIKTEFHRYNFKTGEDEILTLKENLKETYGHNLEEKFSKYTIIDDKVWYIYGTEETGFSMFIYDPNANTTVLVEEFEGKLLDEIGVYDENGVLEGIYWEHYNTPKPKYDGKYLYIGEGGFDAGEYSKLKVHIFTLEGDRLGGFVFGGDSSCQVNILDETFYIQTEENTLFCSVSDVISGNIEWKELYQFEKGED